jgi:hypothetical protein
MADEGEAVKANGRRCPKCGAMIDHLDYWERAINTGEYWQDGFHNVIASDVDECYFLCPEMRQDTIRPYRGRRQVPERPAHKRGRNIPGLLAPHNPPSFYFPLSGEAPRNKGGLFIMSGCGSMRVVVGWFRGNYDAYFEAYEVGDEEFQGVLEEVSDDDPDHDPDWDIAYYVRGRGRLVCKVEPSYTIIVNDAR